MAEKTVYATITEGIEWYTSDDVAAMYRTAAGTVRYWRCINKGPKSVKVGRRVLYSADALREYNAKIKSGEVADAHAAAAH